MALQTALVEIITPTSTGPQSITSLSFRPQVVKFYSTLVAAGSETSTPLSISIGAADDHGNQFVGSTRSDDSVSTSSCDRYINDSECIAFMDSAGSVLISAEFDGTLSNGFTLDWTAVSTVARQVFALCIGGMTDIQVGSKQYGSGTGNHAYTIATGHNPDAMELFAFARSSVGVSSAGVMVSAGMADETTQHNIAGSSVNGQSTSNSQRYRSTSNILSIVSMFSATVSDQASLNSFDANGFTLNFSLNSNESRYFHYISYQGVEASVDELSQKSTSGTQAYTGIGFQPEIVTAFSHNAGSTGFSNSMPFAYGSAFSASANDQAAINGIDQDNKSVTETWRHQYLGRLGSYVDLTPTTYYTFALDSFDSDGFTLDWTATDGSARLFSILSLKSNAESTLSPNNLNQSHSLGAVVLTQKNTLSADSLAHAMSLGAVDLTQKNTLFANGLTHAMSLGAVSVSSAVNLIIQGLNQSHSIDAVDLTQKNTISVDDLAHSQTVGTVTLSTAQLLAIANLIHSHGIDALTVSTVNVLAVDNMGHSHDLGSMNLTQAHDLLINDLQHNQTLASVSFASDAGVITIEFTQQARDMDFVQAKRTIDFIQEAK